MVRIRVLPSQQDTCGAGAAGEGLVESPRLRRSAGIQPGGRLLEGGPPGTPAGINGGEQRGSSFLILSHAA